jgi:hypothetical protein
MKESNKINVYLAFDISTTCIGISLFNEIGNLLEINHLVLKTDSDVESDFRYLVKSNFFKDYIQKYKDYNVIDIFIEDPLLGSNNIFTAALLLKFNGICTYILHDEFKVLPKHITVHEVRKTMCPEFVKIDKKGKETLSFPKELDKKQYIQQKISKIFPDIEWVVDKKGKFSKYNYDISDSIAVGLAMLKKNEIIG